MNTTDLPRLIRECVDGGTRPVSFSEIRDRAARRGSVMRPVRRRARLAVAAGGLAAAGIAGALVASQVGGGTAAGPRTVLTAAMVRHVASASWAAMTSGQADIDWVASTSSTPVIQEITFDGSNWNDVMNPGQPLRERHIGNRLTSWTGESIERVVDGQVYHYPALLRTPTPHVVLGWMQIDIPGAAQPLDIPDPRALLGVLSPSAGFTSAGSTTVNGVTLEELQASTPGAVSLTPLNQLIDSEPDNAALSALDLWVNSSDVVVKAQLTVSGTDGDGNAQSVTVTVTFSRIGQPQAITVPSPILATFGHENHEGH
jgi:hypothetical protein